MPNTEVNRHSPSHACKLYMTPTFQESCAKQEHLLPIQLDDSTLPHPVTEISKFTLFCFEIVSYLTP